MERESFSAVLAAPKLSLDPVDRFPFDTQGTVGIGVEVLVTFACDEAPKVDATVITGLNQIGFIISSEYDVKAYVDRVEVEQCEKPGCEKAKRYKIDVKFFVYLKIGIGFGLGWGTGTAGWTSKAREQVKGFETRCICCDRHSLEP